MKGLARQTTTYYPHQGIYTETLSTCIKVSTCLCVTVHTLTSFALLFNSSFKSAVVFCPVHQHIQKSCTIFPTQYYHEMVCAKKNLFTFTKVSDRDDISGRWVDLSRKVNTYRVCTEKKEKACALKLVSPSERSAVQKDMKRISKASANIFDGYR